MASIATINVDLVARSGQFSRGVGIARGELNTFNSAAVRTSVSVERSFLSVGASAVKMATGVAAAVAAIKGVGSAANLAIDSVKMASEAEKTAGAFRIMVGDAKQTTELISRLRRYAAESPFSFRTSSETASQLLGAGIAPDQVVPTLRMVGDLAAGDTDKLKRLAYAFVQVKAAGRLMGTELRQIAETGLPINDAIGAQLRIPASEVRDAVEEGKVAYDQFALALNKLRTEGGRFFGMTEMYGRSFGGLMEQLNDAIDLTKIEFGNAIIEEMNLKDAARDLTTFTANVRQYVNDLRPAIRFTGDFAKGMVQLTHEGVKFAGVLAQVVGTGFLQAFPEFDGMIGKVQAIAKELQEFKLDPVTAADFALDLTGGILQGLVFVDKALHEIGVDAEKAFVDPFRKAAVEVHKMAEEVRALLKTVNAAKGVAQNPTGLLGVAAGAANTMARDALGLNPPRQELVGDRQALQQQLRDAEALIEQGTRTGNRALIERGKLMRDLTRGHLDMQPVGPLAVAPVQPGKPAVVQMAPAVAPAVADAAKQGRTPGAWYAPLMANLEATFMPEARRRSQEMKQRLLERQAGEFVGRSYTQAAGLVGGTFDALGVSARNAAKAMDEFKVSSWEISAEVRELAKSVKSEFGPKVNPAGAFMKEFTLLRDAAALGKISTAEFYAAGADRIRKLADASGLTDYKLSPVAEYGTAEFSRAALQAFTPNIGNDPVAVLKRLATLQEFQTKQDKELMDAWMSRLEALMGNVIDLP